MQKLVEKSFFCYPKNQNISILYDDVHQLNTRLFKALSLQVSAKEGILLRFRKTNLGHYLSTLLDKTKLKFQLPEVTNIHLGYKSGNKVVFFCFDEHENPIKVLQKIPEEDFIEHNFLGYSIIEKYSKNEYLKKRVFLKSALKKRWQELKDNKKVHGDFTHFNILVSSRKEISFIDDKKVTNSILFDFFYFYSYYLQCLQKCKTINEQDVLTIKNDLQILIKEICVSKDLEHNLKQINSKDAVGLTGINKENMKVEFLNFMLENEK
ncbi:hypothetical protein [Polaribacter porphyrae]|uniref:Uncharacterized protein n=1 Tax=Polaribacter porphyrae TaxID=1137780 RepID=A0A2S7WN52_9FLAO|nr:hypothetical protein [Polaribacter porphyrae]PQJ79045.1 hypothetical protein BTO18_07610 [Polaribacter porphyrae]